MPTIPATATITIRNNPSLIGRVHDSLSSVGGGSASRWASACFLKHDARETAPFYHKQWLSRRSRVDAYCSRTPGESSVRCGDPGSLQALPLDRRARLFRESRSASASSGRLAPALEPRPRLGRWASLWLKTLQLDQPSEQRLFRRSGAFRQHPVRARKVTRVAVRDALEIVLMLRLRLPKRTGRGDLGHHLSWP
jgi:hypothetical protein